MKQDLPYYLFLSRASDVKHKKGRICYRILEMLPGICILSTFTIFVVLSIYKPFWVGLFIIGFALYWFLKILYFSIYLRNAYKKIKINQKQDWNKKIQEIAPKEYTADVKSYKDIWHLVILPMYNESFEIVDESFQALIETTYDKKRMMIVLATEEKGGAEAEKTAHTIQKKYAKDFQHFLITKHPSDVVGEIAGKGSNDAYAAKVAQKKLIDKHNIPYKNIIVSCLDIDTIVYPQYFTCVAYHFLTTPNPYRTSFQPVPYFINNIWQAPAPSRISAFSSTFWHAMNQERPEKHITFSSHSMNFATLVEVGFWQTNVVSEDSRIFWQCFLCFDGDYRVKGIYYPVSMDANLSKTFMATMKSIYLQQRRWAYGVADIPYFIYGFTQNKKVSLRKFLQYAIPTMEGFYSWATHALILAFLGWLPVWIGTNEFQSTLFSYNFPHITRIILAIAMVGILASAYMAITLLPPRPPNISRKKYISMVLQWVLVPITMILFGALPAIEAQLRLMLGKYLGFLVTEKHR